MGPSSSIFGGIWCRQVGGGRDSGSGRWVRKIKLLLFDSIHYKNCHKFLIGFSCEFPQFFYTTYLYVLKFDFNCFFLCSILFVSFSLSFMNHQVALCSKSGNLCDYLDNYNQFFSKKFTRSSPKKACLVSLWGKRCGWCSLFAFYFYFGLPWVSICFRPNRLKTVYFLSKL